MTSIIAPDSPLEKTPFHYVPETAAMNRQSGSGFIGTQMGWGQVKGFDLRSLGLAILGGVLVLFLVWLFHRGS